jgi:polysaccharide export outer membrane protein
MATVLAARRPASLTANCTQEWLSRSLPRLAIGSLLALTTALTGAAGAAWAQQSQVPAKTSASPASVSQGAGTPVAAPAQPPPKTAPAEPSYALLLDAGDLLDIRVFDTPELSEKLRVDQGGEITLPVGGVVKVKGLTAEQAQTAIEERFRQRNILHDPHLEVFVLEYATQGVTVAGEVKLPGVYPWSGKRTVLDFVSLAGGVTPAASKTFTLTHKTPGAAIITAVLGDSSPKAEVEPGDLIVVTQAGVVYVVGDVGKPGGYLIENKETITVLQALALAQGMNKTAKYDAKLIRNSPAGRTEADLPLKPILANQVTDPKLQDGDILFVPVSGGKQWADKSMTSILQMAVGVVIYGRL